MAEALEQAERELPPRLNPNRREAFQVYAEDSHGEVKCRTWEIKRGEAGKICQLTPMFEQQGEEYVSPRFGGLLRQAS